MCVKTGSPVKPFTVVGDGDSDGDSDGDGDVDGESV